MDAGVHRSDAGSSDKYKVLLTHNLILQDIEMASAMDSYASDLLPFSMQTSESVSNMANQGGVSISFTKNQ